MCRPSRFMAGPGHAGRVGGGAPWGIGSLPEAMVIYLWITAVGYLTFGTAAEGLILNNYSDKARHPGALLVGGY